MPAWSPARSLILAAGVSAAVAVVFELALHSLFEVHGPSFLLIGAVALAGAFGAWAALRRSRRELDVLEREIQGRTRAEAALRDSERRYRGIVDTATDAIFTADAESGLILDCNPAAERLTGRLREALLGVHNAELYPPEDRERLAALFLQHVAEGGRVSEVSLLHLDGRRIPVEVSSWVQVLKGRRLITGICRDLTERKRLEDQLHLSDRLVEATPDHVAILDRDFRYLRVNRAYQEAHGEGRSEIEGRTVPELMGRQTFDELIRPRLDAAFAGEDVRYERWFEFARFGRRYQQVSYLPLRDREGAVDRVAVVSRDLTDHRRMEDVLRDQREYLSTLFANLDDMLFVLDADGRITDVNPRVEARLGYPRGELIGRPVLDVHPEDCHQEAREILRGLFAGTTVECNLPLVTRDGSRIPVETRIANTRIDGRDVIIGIARDVTERLATQEALRLSEARYRAVVEEQSELICRWRPDATVTFVNDAYCRYFGKARDELLGRSFFTLIPEAEHEAVRGIIRDKIGAIRPERPITTTEHRVVDADGRVRWQQWVDRGIFDGAGRLVELQSVGRDITERKEMDERLLLAAAVIENTPEGVMISDATQLIISVNPAFTATTGYGADEAVGATPAILRSGRHGDEFYQGMWESLSRYGHWQGEIWNRRKSGEIYPEWLNINVIRDADGKVTHYVGIFSDITTQEHVKRRLHNLAYYDALTELPNRALFQDRLAVALNKAGREESRVALLFFDLDRFKTINDTLGHTIGDRLLKAVADRLAECVRDSDTVARLGGDEFTIVLSEVPHSADAAKVAEKLLRAFAEPFRVEGEELFVTPSIGISLFPDDGLDPETLIKNADTAMYRAKDHGRNNFQFYAAEMSDRFSERLALENDLRRALATGRISVAYQPQVSLADGRIRGVEALARWHHETRGWIPPGVFIPVAEEVGLAVVLGEHVLRAACRDAAAWVGQGHADLRVAVNLSGWQVRNGGIDETVSQVLADTGLAPRNLALELTESVLMEQGEGAVEALIRVHRLGVHIAIDDFGTGYSSLSYLKRFAVDTLKIDRSFVRDIGIDRNDAEIAATIIVMAHNLNLQVIAEGVENREQLEFLRARGCDEIQGFLFARPMDAQSLGRMLADPPALPDTP